MFGKRNFLIYFVFLYTVGLYGVIILLIGMSKIDISLMLIDPQNILYIFYFIIMSIMFFWLFFESFVKKMLTLREGMFSKNTSENNIEEIYTKAKKVILFITIFLSIISIYLSLTTIIENYRIVSIRLSSIEGISALSMLFITFSSFSIYISKIRKTSIEKNYMLLFKLFLLNLSVVAILLFQYRSYSIV